ncbi:general secretion pathway protein L [Oxalobacteraceae bacterium GrIS 2.11]
MNTLYLRIPPKHTASWPDTALSFAVSSLEGNILREGRSTLKELAASISKSNVVLIIAATDVTLLELSIPPMPEAKLKLALPNLVEDQLMGDPAECVLLLGAKSASSNKRSVAVAQRSWLQQLSASLFALGANQVKAVPAQLCLPWKKDQCSASLEGQLPDATLTLRFGEESGVGIMLEPEQKLEECLATIAMLAPAGPITLQLPFASVNELKAVIKDHADWEQRFTVSETKWSATVQAVKLAGFNLMAGLNSAQTNRIQWQMWRWPLILATLVLLVNIGALNYDYWNLKREAQALKQGMLQTYKATFPKETVVVFPLEQMRKNLDVAQRGAGLPSPDDFTLLLTQFGAAWNTLGPNNLARLVSIEYKERGLLVQIKGEMPQKQLQPELDSRGLVLKKNNAEIWQVKVAK